MRLLILILVMGAATFAIRFSCIALFGRIAIPPLLARAMRFVPASVLTAIILPDLCAHGNNGAITPSSGRVIAIALAALVAWRTKNALLTIAVGMIALLLYQNLRF